MYAIFRFFTHILRFLFFINIQNGYSKRKDSTKQSHSDKILYNRIDILMKSLEDGDYYEIVPVTDEMMGINDTINNPRMIRKKFMNNLGSNITKVGAYIYQRPGCHSNWIAVFKIEKGRVDQDPKILAAYAQAALDAPKLFTQREAKKAITQIQQATGATNIGLVESLLSVIIPTEYDIIPSNRNNKNANRLEELSDLIKSGDFDETNDVIKLCMDARCVNKRGDTDTSQLEIYWSAMEKVIENGGTASHVRRHTQGNDIVATTNISYSPTIHSISQLMKKTQAMLIEQGKIEGQDFPIPSPTFVNLQLSPMNENRKTTEHFTGRLKVKRQLQAKNARNQHQHGHYVAQQKNIGDIMVVIYEN